MNFYLTGIEGMPKLLECCEGNPMQYFNRKAYPDAFRKMYQMHVPTFDAIEQGYHTVIDKDQFLMNMADVLTGCAAQKCRDCKKRSQREQMMMDLNLTMVAYVFPMILEFHGDSSKPLTEKLQASWKREFPKSALKASEYTYIEAGFHKKFCYITTAVCETLGKGDDCYELRTLRQYRDSYLAALPDGEELIRTYYDVAPSIVKHIDQRETRQDIYRSIWQQYLAPCITMVEERRMEECKELYRNMVENLKREYFIQ